MSSGMKEEKYENCQKATFLLEKRQYKSLSLWDLIFLKYHLFNCALCSIYAKQTLIINALIRDLITHRETSESQLDSTTKEKIKSEINNKLG